MKKAPCTIRSALKEMVQKAQDENRSLIDGQPNKATTPGQWALQKQHGTPKVFARACVQAIGEISPAEAEVAINKYREEWAVA
jgi:hypothetical protein